MFATKRIFWQNSAKIIQEILGDYLDFKESYKFWVHFRKKFQILGNF